MLETFVKSKAWYVLSKESTKSLQISHFSSPTKMMQALSTTEHHHVTADVMRSCDDVTADVMWSCDDVTADVMWSCDSWYDMNVWLCMWPDPVTADVIGSCD